MVVVIARLGQSASVRREQHFSIKSLFIIRDCWLFLDDRCKKVKVQIDNGGIRGQVSRPLLGGESRYIVVTFI